MDENTKQRLVGITVIFALAVIFLPMMFDGSGVRNEVLTVNIPIPEQLDENSEFETKIVELHTNVDALPTIQSGVIDEQYTLIGEAADEPADAFVEVGKRNSDKVKVKPIPSEALAAISLETQAVKKKPGGESYVLQVASFKDETKARLQRDKLRKSKIAAVFIEKSNVKSSPSYRVRLGPFVNRRLSKIAQNKVKAKYNINGLIMVYDP